MYGRSVATSAMQQLLRDNTKTPAWPCRGHSQPGPHSHSHTRAASPGRLLHTPAVGDVAPGRFAGAHDAHHLAALQAVVARHGVAVL